MEIKQANSIMYISTFIKLLKSIIFLLALCFLHLHGHGKAFTICWSMPTDTLPNFPITYLDTSKESVDTIPPKKLIPPPPSLTLQPKNSIVMDSVDFFHFVDSLVTVRTKEKIDTRINLLSDEFIDIPSILPLKLRSAGEPASFIKTRMTSGFGTRIHPISGTFKSHDGIDLPAPLGTPVYATANGVCREVITQRDGIGIGIYLEHSQGHQTLYGHLQVSMVRPGQLVKRGQIIGRVGMTGMTTGPHLHYGLRYKNQVVDPEPYCFLLGRKIADLTARKLSINKGEDKGEKK